MLQGCSTVKGLFGKRSIGDPNDPDFLNRVQELKSAYRGGNIRALDELIDVYQDEALGRIIVEVRAADQVGLLHLIAKTISKCGFSIQFARVATEQGIATDIFNIERASENKNTSPAQFLELREELSKSLNAEKYYVEV